MSSSPLRRIFPAPMLPEPQRLASTTGPRRLTLRQLVERYLEGSAHRLTPESIRTYKVAAKAATHLVVEGVEVLDRPVHEVTQGWAQRVHDAVRERSGGATADKLAKLLGAAHRHAANRGEELPPVPWGAIERWGSPPIEIHFAAGWLLSALDVIAEATVRGELAHPRTGNLVRLPERVADFYTLALCMGPRPWCELRLLRWRDIDTKKGVITFAASKRDKKRRQVRTLPLSILCERGREALDRQRSASEYVWPGKRPGTPAGETNFAKWWVPFRTWAAGLISMVDVHGKPLCLYRAGRHAFASHLGELGFAPHVISEFLGHRDHRTQRRYTHLSGRHMQAPAKKIAASLERKTMHAVALDTAPGIVPERLGKALDWIERRSKIDQLLGQPGPVIRKPDGDPYSARTWGMWRAFAREIGDPRQVRKPDDAVQHQIARAIGISVGWLYGEGPDELPEVTAS